MQSGGAAGAGERLQEQIVCSTAWRLGLLAHLPSPEGAEQGKMVTAGAEAGGGGLLTKPA